MEEAKGAVLSLLMDAYQKRDKVAFIAFRGQQAEVLLEPTGSVEQAYRRLEELPTGGGLPLRRDLRKAIASSGTSFGKIPIPDLFCLSFPMEERTPHRTG